MIRVDIVMRSDYVQKFGGDVAQVQHYVAHMPADIDVRLHAADAHLAFRKESIVHIVNIDRHWDFLEVIRQARPRPVIVSTIHHDRQAVRSIRSLQERSLRTLLEAHLPESSFLLLTRLYRGRSWPRTGPLPPGAYFHTNFLLRLAARAIDGAAVVHVLAEGERAAIERDYGLTLRRVAVIPNGVDPSTDSETERDIDVLVPGRIEARKNQFALAQALDRAEQSAVFVGAAVVTEGSVVRRFSQLVSASPWLTWIPGVAPDEMAALYRRSKVVMNLSRVEVLSLVDLEAYAYGCHLITTTAGHTSEWLGSAATYVDPARADLAVELAQRGLRSWRRREPSADILKKLDWRRITSELVQLYRSLWAQTLAGG